MYAKVKNGQLIKFPYDITDLFAECPESKGKGCDIISLFNESETKKQEGSEIVFVHLEPFPEFDARTRAPTGAIEAKFDGQKWVATYIFRDRTQEEIDAMNSARQQ